MMKFREQRLEQLKREVTKVKEMKENYHGDYVEITEEKEVLKITTTVKKCVVHFFHKEFRRCQIMSKHLEILSRKHFKTRFIKVDVENVPFLVDRLKIQVLPCVIAFIDGVAVDRVVGFEELGNTDSFRTPILEKRLFKSGVVTPTEEDLPAQTSKSIFGFAEKAYDSDEDE
ncbi:thioredoxin-like protein [Paraphysoderma sedebokerense]|nr:thioredoxin-like protein [Paraphysoderma sedebokerense]